MTGTAIDSSVTTRYAQLLDEMRDELRRARDGKSHPRLQGEKREQFVMLLSDRLVKLAAQGAATLVEPFVLECHPPLRDLHPCDAAIVTLNALQHWVAEKTLDAAMRAESPSSVTH